MINFSNPKHYSLVVGAILFIFGLLGFAFRTSSTTPGYVLFACLVLGFWGLLVGAKKS